MHETSSKAVCVCTEEPFFVIGSPRSGTTLMVQILSRHSRLFIPPETEFFYLLSLYGLIDRPFRIPQATRFLDFYLASRPAVMLGLDQIQGLRERLLAGASSYEGMFVRLMAVLGEPSEKARWGEKTPHHLHAAEAILTLFPAAPMIALVRDGRAVTRSRLQKQNWEQNIFGAAKLWERDSRRLRRLLRCHEKRILVVRYEELVNAPRAAIERVCQWLGESFEPQMLDPVAEVEPRFEAYYRQSWMEKATGAIDPSRIEAWRAAFSAQELALINHVQAKELRFWGYPVESARSPGWWALLVREQIRHFGFRIKRKLSLFLCTGRWRFSRRCA